VFRRRVRRRDAARSAPAATGSDRSWGGAEGGLRWRTNEDGLPPATRFISSPYDPEAHLALKHATAWIGYKVHLTETCEPETPNLAGDWARRSRHRDDHLSSDRPALRYADPPAPHWSRLLRLAIVRPARMAGIGRKPMLLRVIAAAATSVTTQALTVPPDWTPWVLARRSSTFPQRLSIPYAVSRPRRGRHLFLLTRRLRDRY
jgi:hypothetical protein